MRIGVFSDGYLPSVTGVTTSVETSVSVLEQRGHTVTIVAPSYPKYKDRAHDVVRIRSVALPGQDNFRVATYLPGTSLLLAARLDVDIIHGHAGGPISWLGWEVARIKRVPFVFTYHTFFNQYTHYFLKGKVIRPHMMEVATRVFGNMTDQVIAPTQKVRDELLIYGVKKPITILPSGIDLKMFRPQISGALRQQLKIPQHEIIFLYAGRIGKEKSIDLVIRSFARTLKQCPTCHLVIAGDGPDRRKLELLATKVGKGRVHFLGFVPRNELPLVYTDADVFVFASKTETQGMVVPEAMACGLPIIAVKDAVYKGVLTHHHEGWLTEHQQIPFSRAMIALAQSPQERQRLGQAALATAQGFSLERVTDQLEALYQGLIRQSPAQDLLMLPPWLRRDRREKLSDE
jgi:1,2-diacylglycerol 3-alpha-glucosyltransferase